MRSRSQPHHGQDPSAQSGGFTLIELMVVTAIIPIAFLASIQLVASGQRADEDARVRASMMDKLQITLSRLSDELRMSGSLGEDLNDNGVLDDDEDRNDNGRFDSDWLVEASSIRFNRMQADGTMSLPVMYSLEGDELFRSQLLDTSGTTLRVSIADRITAFSVLESDGNTVTLEMSTEVPVRGGDTWSQTLSVTLQTRN